MQQGDHMCFVLWTDPWRMQSKWEASLLLYFYIAQCWIDHVPVFRATGVTTQTVEVMEKNLKRDVIREVIANEGRILLHDEVEERPGVFSIVAQWENVDTDDILTPRDVFDLMAKEGFKVCGHAVLIFLPF